MGALYIILQLWESFDLLCPRSSCKAVSAMLLTQALRSALPMRSYIALAKIGGLDVRCTSSRSWWAPFRVGKNAAVVRSRGVAAKQGFLFLQRCDGTKVSVHYRRSGRLSETVINYPSQRSEVT